MKKAKITNKREAIQILRSARYLIETRTELFTCHAITRAVKWDRHRSDTAHNTAHELSMWITKNLVTPERHHACLESWIKSTCKLDSLIPDLRRVRITRLAWIDWMIKELEALL